jgi:hypothetical protein
MAERYNAAPGFNLDVNGNSLRQQYIYAQRVYMRYNNPGIYIPPGTGDKNNVEYRYNPQKGY